MAGSIELNGRFDALVPVIPISLPHGVVDAILDTGFDGFLMLPTAEFERLSPIVELVAEVTTASGEMVPCRACRARIEWLGEEIEANVIEAATSFTLVGMELLKDAETVLRPAEGVLRIRRIG